MRTQLFSSFILAVIFMSCYAHDIHITRKALSEVQRGPTELAQLEESLSQVQTQATFLNKLAQSLRHIEKFNSAVASHGEKQTVASLAQAFQNAGTAAKSLADAHKGLSQINPSGNGQVQQTLLAQSESMEGIISLLKKAYHIIEQIK